MVGIHLINDDDQRDYIGGVSKLRAPAKSSYMDTSQLRLVGRANCVVCVLENIPVQSFLVFSYVVSIMFPGDTLNKSTQIHSPWRNKKISEDNK